MKPARYISGRKISPPAFWSSFIKKAEEMKQAGERGYGQWKAVAM